MAFVLPFPRVLFPISLLIRLSHTGAPCMSTFPVKFQQRIKRPVKLNFSVLVASLLRLDMCYFFIFLYFFFTASSKHLVYRSAVPARNSIDAR